MGKGIYIVALIATIAIIALLWFSISASEDSKANQINDEIRQLSLENELFNSFADFDTNNKEVYCTVLDQSISSLSKRADALEVQLSTYKENSFNSREFVDAKKNYLMTSMLLLRSFEKAREFCDFNRKAVIFFYAEDKSCDPACGIIGLQLVDLSRDCNSFRAFNFPFEWNQYPFTKIIEVKYDVNTPGTVIIDGNKYIGAMKSDAFSHVLGCS